jgi:hypothetical protein
MSWCLESLGMFLLDAVLPKESFLSLHLSAFDGMWDFAFEILF